MTDVTQELDDLVEEWHKNDTGLSMPEFLAGRLGWTPDDVRLWVANPNYRPSA